LKYCGSLDSEAEWSSYLGEILLGMRCLVTRAHGLTPFFVVHGFQADLPHYLRTASTNLPTDAAFMTDAELASYGDAIADRALEV
jgi:hypothetical protein